MIVSPVKNPFLKRLRFRGIRNFVKAAENRVLKVRLAK